jgi:multiple sugar transport system ATP-binding protein
VAVAVVALSGVRKTYPGDVPALHHTDLSVKDGELLVLVGPSGCGKTTLLRIIAGLEEPSGGRVFIGDRDVTSLHPRDRDVAMVFQSYALYPHMTVFDNMAFGLRMRKTPREELRTRVESAARKLDISHLLARKPGALSGGQRQRVALGRAIVREPKVFLLDEPLSNLDAVLRAQMRTELVRIHRALGRTMIYVTHDQTEAMTMGDSIAVMAEGRLLQIGSPAEVYDRPATKFVACFIGSPPMNLWRATVTEGGRLITEGGNAPLDLPSEWKEALRGHEGRDVLAGIRPQELTLSIEEAEGHSLKGVVEMAEYTGSEVYLRISCSSGDFVAKAPDKSSMRPGDHVHLGIPASSLHLFEIEGGSRLNR